MEYLAILRVRRAQHLLRRTTLSVKEIAFRVGVRDPLYFSRLFRKVVGQSPRAWRASDAGIAELPNGQWVTPRVLVDSICYSCLKSVR